MAVFGMSAMGASVLGFRTPPRSIGTARTTAPRSIGTARQLPGGINPMLAVQRSVVGTHASDNTVLGPQLTGGGTGMPGSPVVVDHPVTGATLVTVPHPVAQAIASGDPNAAAAVNAAAGGSPGGGATPTSASGATSDGAPSINPTLFGLGILFAAGAIVFIVGRHVK